MSSLATPSIITFLQLKISSLTSAQNRVNYLQPTAIYLSSNLDAAFKEVVEKVLDEHVPDSNDAASTIFDATQSDYS